MAGRCGIGGNLSGVSSAGLIHFVKIQRSKYERMLNEALVPVWLSNRLFIHDVSVYKEGIVNRNII